VNARPFSAGKNNYGTTLPPSVLSGVLKVAGAVGRPTRPPLALSFGNQVLVAMEASLQRREGSSSISSSSMTRSMLDRKWPSSTIASAKWSRNTQAAWPDR
jgi:hypothetical protein